MKKYCILFASALAAISCNDKKETLPPGAPPAAPEKPAQFVPSNGRYCYLQVTGKDSMMLNAEVKGDSIKGTFDWLPLEKDKKTSVFKGRLTGTTAHAISTAMAEGTTNKEELIFTLQDSTAAVKFGEMLQGDNGVWMYKNKNAARDQVLRRVDCKE